ncbi:MAG TPA: hypothetical protein P5127_01980 [Oscillospiraceae bacterium]|nr:hypothetical protein [Oscillospiraceae bacterium]
MNAKTFFEQLRCGYDVSNGKINNAEVDLIATDAKKQLYIQVTA